MNPLTFEQATVMLDKIIQGGTINFVLNLVQITLFIAIVALWAWDRRRQLMSIEAVEDAALRSEAATVRSNNLLTQVEHLIVVISGYAKVTAEQKQSTEQIRDKVLGAIQSASPVIGTATNPFEIVVHKPPTEDQLR